MKKDLKQKIKQDEFVGGVERTWGWLQAHWDEVKVTGSVIVAVAVGAGVLAYFQSHRDDEARQAFAAALEIYHAPVVSETPEGLEKPTGLVFDAASQKYAKAAAAFDGVQGRFGSLAVGVRARYYAALCRIEMGQAQEAEKALTEIAARKDLALESALARLALADLMRRTGQTDKAVEAYRHLAEDASLAIPRDHALMSLASTLEEAHRLADAKAAYRRLTEEFPESAYAGEAQHRAQYLETGDRG